MKKNRKNLKHMHKVMLIIFLRFKKKRGDLIEFVKKKIQNIRKRN